MPRTHFPNGVSAQLTSVANASAGAGDLDCANLYTSGTVNAAVFVGEVATIHHTFGSASTAETVYMPAPFNGDIIKAYVAVVTSARVAAYTVQQGSAGTVNVSSEANTTGVAGSLSDLTVDTAAITTASGIKFLRGTRGSTGITILSLVVRRT